MVLCKFYQQGNCRFGPKCNNEHVNIKETLTNDIEASINGKQWPFSCYGPFKDKGNIPNYIDDQSFEEMRLLCYEAKERNMMQQFHQQFAQRALDCTNKMKALQQATPEIIQMVIGVHEATADAPKPAVGGGLVAGVNPFGMSGGVTNPSGSIFAKQTTSQTGVGLFGATSGGSSSTGAVGFGSTTAPNVGGGIFGGTSTPSQGLFGGASMQQQQPQQQQQTSIFGQSAAMKPTNSIFGGGSSTPLFGQSQAQGPAPGGGNIFGQAARQTASAFGQQPQQNLFGQAMQQQQQQQQQQQPMAGGGLFGQMAQQSNAGQNLFGQQPQQQQQQPTSMINPSPFGGTAGQQNPAQQQNIFTQQQQQQMQTPQSQLGSGNIFAQAVQQTSGQGPPSGFFSTQPPPPGQQQQQPPPPAGASSVYSRLEDLSAAEIEAFKANQFETGKIPFNPPPRELVN